MLLLSRNIPQSRYARQPPLGKGASICPNQFISTKYDLFFTAPVFIDYSREAVTAVNTALNILFCHKLADKRAVLRRVGNTLASYQARLAVKELGILP